MRQAMMCSASENMPFLSRDYGRFLPELTFMKWLGRLRNVQNTIQC